MLSLQINESIAEISVRRLAIIIQIQIQNWPNEMTISDIRTLRLCPALDTTRIVIIVCSKQASKWVSLSSTCSSASSDILYLRTRCIHWLNAFDWLILLQQSASRLGIDQNLQRHRAVSLRQHGFLVLLFTAYLSVTLLAMFLSIRHRYRDSSGRKLRHPRGGWKICSRLAFNV